MPLSPAYNPKQWESAILSLWRDQDVGSPEAQSEAQGLEEMVTHDSVFTIIMPPPNLTGNLHAGHAFGHYLMDTLIRINRQKGIKSLWFPGVDHAGLQMEGVINALLKSEGKDRKTVSNKDFLALTWKKANEWRANQKNQSGVLGSTPDYGRELFTLDPRATKMVEFAYQQYWQDDLLYKGSYLVNWSVGLQTALSDVSGEIIYATMVDQMVTFHYDFVRVEHTAPGISDQTVELLEQYFVQHPIAVATVRPETIGADIAVAIHPETLRELLHKARIDIAGQELIIQAVDSGLLKIIFALPSFGLARVPLVTSSVIDKDFGTGALKITPAHAKVDYDLYNELVARAVLPSGFATVIGRDGTMTLEAGARFVGKTIAQARSIAVDLLAESSNLESTADYEHSVALCERTKTVIEPLISEEFFLSMSRPTRQEGLSLAELALKGVSQTKFYPAQYRERGESFVRGIQDWCISRDLTWGHSMPVWYNVDLNPQRTFYSPKVSVAMDALGVSHPVSELFRVQPYQPVEPGNWVREQKILDTWFSSSLWPLTTLDFYTAQQKIQGVAFDINGVLLEGNEPNEKAVAFLKQLVEAGIPAYYLTNSDQESFDVLQKQPFYSYFSGGIKSFDTPFAKPDPEFYEYFIHKYNLDPHKVVYIDDLEKNRQSAKKLGFITVNYHSGTDLFYEFDSLLESIVTDFEQFYPTQVMTTAKEIFYLWIVRMIMLGEYFTGHTPFEQVVITPTVLDGNGKKMSKSLGNGIKPEEEIEKYSSDTLRLSLLGGMIPDRSMRFGGGVATVLMEKNRNFGNKLWNIARFFEYQAEQGWEYEPLVSPVSLTSANQWILEKYIQTTRTIDQSVQQFELAKAVDALVVFLWDEYADWYVEYLKTDQSSLDFAYALFKHYVQLLSPFAPFECEVLWAEYFEAGSLLALELRSDEWLTEIDISHRFEFEHCIELVTELRSLRGLFAIDPGTSITVYARTNRLEPYREYISKIAKGQLSLADELEGYIVAVDDCEYGVHIKSYIEDLEGEVRRSKKLYDSALVQKKAIDIQLSNPVFLEKASEIVIREKRNQLLEREKEMAQLQKKITFLTSA
jgi:valyl-tRNA synthetase